MADALPSIVIVDDATEIRALIRVRVRLSRAFDVVGEGSTGHDAVRLAEEHQPTLMLLDVSMPEMDGLEAIPGVLAASPETKIVMFSGFEEEGLSERATALGAVAFVRKSLPIAELADRLLAVLGTTITPEAVTPTPTRYVEHPAAGDQATLDEHLERFRTAFDQAAIGMGTLTLTGRVVRANAALHSLAGDIVGRRYADIADDSTRADVDSMITATASGANDVATAVHRIGEAWALSTTAIVRDSSGSPLYLFIQVRDVTEQRAADEALRQSEERFRLLVEQTADYAIFMLDPGGHISSWNIGAQRIKGYSAAEIIGQHFSVFYTDEARASRHPQYELDVARSSGRYEEEGWRVRKDGTQFWANVVITAVHDGTGALVGFAKVTRDMTERRAARIVLEQANEQLTEAADERTAFLAVTAHELRGPVALLRGNAELLRDAWRDLDDELRDETIATLVSTSDRLTRLVEDLLTATRLESGAVEVHGVPTPLAPIVAHVVREQALRYGDAPIEMACPPDAIALADGVRLTQILANLVANALRYGAPPYAVTVELVGEVVEIAVVDAGPGVPESIRPRLFGKFVHGTHEDSNGLGLYIVRQLAEAQGGSVAYEPERSRFVVRLPTA